MENFVGGASNQSDGNGLGELACVERRNRGRRRCTAPVRAINELSCRESNHSAISQPIGNRMEKCLDFGQRFELLSPPVDKQLSRSNHDPSVLLEAFSNRATAKVASLTIYTLINARYDAATKLEQVSGSKQNCAGKYRARSTVAEARLALGMRASVQFRQARLSPRWCYRKKRKSRVRRREWGGAQCRRKSLLDLRSSIGVKVTIYVDCDEASSPESVYHFPRR